MMMPRAKATWHQHPRKLSVVSDRLRSICSVSLVNRFMSLPVGCVSKKEQGSSRVLSSSALCRFRAAVRDP